MASVPDSREKLSLPMIGVGVVLGGGLRPVRYFTELVSTRPLVDAGDCFRAGVPTPVCGHGEECNGAGGSRGRPLLFCRQPTNLQGNTTVTHA